MQMAPQLKSISRQGDINQRWFHVALRLSQRGFTFRGPNLPLTPCVLPNLQTFNPGSNFRAAIACVRNWPLINP